MNIVLARNLADRPSLVLVFVVPDTFSAQDVRDELLAKRKGHRKHVRDGVWDIRLVTSDVVEIAKTAREVANYLRGETT